MAAEPLLYCFVKRVTQRLQTLKITKECAVCAVKAQPIIYHETNDAWYTLTFNSQREPFVMTDTNTKTDLEERQSKNQVEAKQEPSKNKPVYKKPELRKYTQIDYVTAYGVD